MELIDRAKDILSGCELPVFILHKDPIPGGDTYRIEEYDEKVYVTYFLGIPMSEWNDAKHYGIVSERIDYGERVLKSYGLVVNRTKIVCSDGVTRVVVLEVRKGMF